MSRRATRLLVDCNLVDLNNANTGIPRVTLAYLEEACIWAKQNDIDVIPIYPTGSSFRVAENVPANCMYRAPRKSSVSFFKSSQVSSGQNNDAGHQSEVNVSSNDIIFCPAYWHDVDPNIYRLASRKGAYVSTLVHDLLPISFKTCYNSPWRDDFKKNAVAAIGYSDAIFAVSHYTLECVKELALRSGSAMPYSQVAYNGFRPLPHLPAAEISSYLGNVYIRRLIGELPSPLLMVGTIEPKKAHVPVIQTMSQLWDAGYARPLVIVGRRGWLDDDIVNEIQNSSYLGSRLFWFSDLDDADLGLCYKWAHALVFASLGEGFGIPMIEAAMCRTPILAFDTEISREILKDHGVFFETTRQFVDALLRLSDNAQYDSEVTSLEAFNWPTWAEVAPKLFETMVGLAASRSVNISRFAS